MAGHAVGETHRPTGAAEPGPGFGAVLRGLREQAGLSQEELAERAGVTAYAISALERGRRTRPYPHTVRALVGALGLDGAQRDALLAALPRRSPAPVALSVVPAPRPAEALPVPATPLVGREEEIAELAALLQGSPRRLLTLTGTGGVGKTRLADAVAARVAPSYAEAASAGTP